MVSAQKPDADAAKLADQYIAAFNKGDAKALTALYTADATRLGPDGQLLTGRAAIEKGYMDGFAGPLKGSTLTLQQGRTQAVTPDVKIMEGRFTVSAAAQLKGRYVNTIVRQGGTLAPRECRDGSGSAAGGEVAQRAEGGSTLRELLQQRAPVRDDRQATPRGTVDGWAPLDGRASTAAFAWSCEGGVSRLRTMASRGGPAPAKPPRAFHRRGR